MGEDIPYLNPLIPSYFYASDNWYLFALKCYIWYILHLNKNEKKTNYAMGGNAKKKNFNNFKTKILISSQYTIVRYNLTVTVHHNQNYPHHP